MRVWGGGGTGYSLTHMARSPQRKQKRPGGQTFKDVPPGFYVVRITAQGEVIFNPESLYVAWRYVTNSLLVAVLVDTVQAVVAAVAIAGGSMLTTYAIERMATIFPTSGSTNYLIDGLSWVGDGVAFLTFVWFAVGGFLRRVQEWRRAGRPPQSPPPPTDGGNP